jgi:superfamily I DNA/RNA helicase
MDFNEQQAALFTWGATETGSCNLIARAGTGKTTTIIELAKRISGKVFLGAFNKAIAEELKTRINKPNVTAGTMHSLGFSLWRNVCKGRSEIDAKKVAGIIKRLELFTYDHTPKTILNSAVMYGKQSGFGLPGLDYKDSKTWGSVFDHYDLWDELPGSVSPDRMIEACIKVYTESLVMCQKQDPLIDFDDMILAPLVFGRPVPMYDWVMIDEAQDTNMVRRKLAEWVLKPEGRMVAVGDPKQAIYGFSGANADSMDQIKERMNSIELPLSITYRCPKTVVALAQTLVPDIQAHESAPEGVVRVIGHQAFWKEELRDTDVILCRNTRPLIGVAKRLRKMGIPCAVEGANGKSLIALASKWGEDIQISQMEQKLAVYVNLQVVKWEGKNRLDKAEGIRERQECLLDIASELEEFDSVRSLVKHIEEMFGERYGEDNRRILRLCTVHRSKGREWDRVFLLGRNVYMPSKWAKAEWELGQEDNLVYVAWTRAKRELVEVNCKLKKDSSEPDWWEL